jgi:hypothetical protein
VNVTVVGLPTTCGAAESFPLLLSQPFVPVKAAVTVWLPAASADVLKDACPAASTATLLARVVAPSVNVTEPVGVPLAPLTVAVNVTAWPTVEGLGDEVSAVVVELGDPVTDAVTQLLAWNGQVRIRYP